MATDLETIPTSEDEEERKRRLGPNPDDPLETLRRNAAAIGTSGAPAEDYDTEGFKISHVSPSAVKDLGAHDANSPLGKVTRRENLGNFAMDARPEPVGVKPMDLSGAPELGSPEPVNGGLQSLSATPALKTLSFGERQALPTVSPGAPIGSSASTEAKLARLQDQRNNPLGSPENHPGFGGKLAHVLGRIGNIAGDIVAPETMQLIPGTQLNREAAAKNLNTRLEQERTQEETVRKNKATEAGEQEDRALEARKLDILENKPLKPENVDQRAVDAKIKEINPATGKNYTDYEARIELANDIAAGKAKAPGNPKTIVMLDKEGKDGKPYQYEYDASKEYSGEEGYGHFRKVGPAQPNAISLGLIGSVMPLLDPNGQIVGTYNTKLGDFKPLNPSQAAVVGPGGTGGTTPSGARLQATRTNQFNTQYVNPANQIETNYQKAGAAMDAYNNNPQTGAAGMVMLSQHIATTLGGVKGVSTGETMIHEHENAIGLEQRIARMSDYFATGQPLSADQMNEFNHIIKETRDITWNVAAKEAARRKQKIDFLPDDVQVNLKDASGKARPVPGNRVQEYLDKGARF